MADADMTATLNNLTVLELQQELKKRGLKRSGLKPKLVARLAEHMQNFGDDMQQETTGDDTPQEKSIVEEKKMLDITDPHPYNEEYEQQLVNDANDEPIETHNKKENGDNRFLDIDQRDERATDDAEETENVTNSTHAAETEEVADDSMGSPTFDPVEDDDAARDMAEQLTEPIHTSKDHKRMIEVEEGEEEGDDPQAPLVEEDTAELLQDNVPEENVFDENNREGEVPDADVPYKNDEGNEEEESKMQDKEMEDNDEVLEEDGKDEDLEERHIDQDEGVTEKEHEDKEEEDVREDDEQREEETRDDVEEKCEEGDEDMEGGIDIQPTEEDKDFLEDDAEEEDEEKKPAQKPVTPVLLKKRLSTATDETDEEKKAKRKRRWGNTAESSVTISSDSIKKLIPDVKLDSSAVETLPELDYQEDENEFAEEAEEEKKDADEEISQEEEEGDGERKRKGRRVKVDSAKKIKMGQPDDKGVVVVESDSEARRKSQEAEVVDLEGEERAKSADVRTDSTSQWLFISGLVRPYTINQLKNLLGKTGTIAENGFWINNIKSFCYVKMSTEDEIKATVESLHGKTWPTGSPKTLHVEYALNEVVYASTEGAIGDKPKIVIEIDDKENEAKAAAAAAGRSDAERKKAKQEHQERKKLRETERQEKADRQADRQTDRQADRQERRKERKSMDGKTPDKAQQKEAKRKEEESPAKLLDDLFRKTKATPCIYWLPLTEDQILEREKEEQELEKQKMRRERERLERIERDNNRGRRSSPRRNTSRRRSRSRERGWR